MNNWQLEDGNQAESPPLSRSRSLGLIISLTSLAFVSRRTVFKCYSELEGCVSVLNSATTVNEPTKADAGVLIADILTLLVGKEHVGRQATLGSVGICSKRDQ